VAKGANSLRGFGVDLVGAIPWGAHLCQFYSSKQDLIDILVPYFVEGLRSNEFCIWVTSTPLGVEEAKVALQAQVPNLPDYIKKGQIEIVSYDQWYLAAGKFDSAQVLKKWVDKEKSALSNGFEGLRLTGNTFWVEHNLWSSFVDYERAINSTLRQHKIIALCTYSLEKCSGSDVLDVLRNHAGTLVKQNDKWLLLEDAARRKAVNGALKVSKQKYSSLFQNMASGFAYHKVVYDPSGKPVDYVFLEINAAFEVMTGLKHDGIIGRRVTSVLPGIENDPADWIGVYGKVASTGKTARFESYNQALNKWFSVSAFSPENGYFVATFEDITEKKKAEETLIQSEKRLELSQEIAHLGSWDLDLVTNKLTWTAEVFRIFGLKQQEFVATYEDFLEVVHPDDRSAVNDAYKRSIVEGTDSYEIEHRVVRKLTGEVRFVHEKCEHVRDKSGRIVRSIGMVQDITERKKAEENLQYSNSKLKLISNIANQLLSAAQPKALIQELCEKVMSFLNCDVFFNYLVDEQKSSLHLNAYAGVPQEVARNIEWLSFGEAVCGCAAKEARLVVCENIQETNDVRANFVRSFGVKAYAAYPLFSHGKVLGTLSFGSKQDPFFNEEDHSLMKTVAAQVSIAIERNKDEEALKENEARLKKLNLTLRAISNSNQAIIRATDEETFLHEACRVLVEDCGYKMVWVGLAMDDPEKSVKPVAFSGFDKGYLDSLKITWADTTRGQGPTGRAIRTGEPQFCQSMKNDERFKPWREEALKRGYESSISLPLKIDAKVIGVLTLYSTESTVPSEEEVKLLSELANDFSQGIKILRIRKEKEQAEAELQRQAALIDLSPDAIFVRNLDGAISFWSKGAEKMYGWTKEEVIGQNCHSKLETCFPAPYENIIAKIKQSGRWSGELIHATKDGRQITVQSFWQAIFDLNGDIVELLESNVDITERKQFEQALERAKVDWERTFNSVPDLIAILDDKHRIVRANKAMAQALGLTPERCVGLNCYTCVHDQEAPPMFCPHSQAMKDGQEHTAEVHEERLGGDFIVSATPLKDEHGHILGSVHVARNITLRKQMENKLEEYSKELAHLVEERTKQLRDSERLAAIGATAGMVGHDIRNPLQAIASSLYLAKTDLDTVPEGKTKESLLESLVEIEKNVDYINKIVVDLQDFAKPLKPILGEIDLKAIIQEVIKNRSIPENIFVQSSVDSKANCFIADSTYIRRMLNNLVNNALQAMPNGGKLTINAVCETESFVITVEDTGMGIPEEVKSKLFTPLFTTKSKGQGFGLAVVKRMSEALGGCVSFESKTGSGTKFIVRLPSKR
jgi:PAS domain S-box-containing protein